MDPVFIIPAAIVLILGSALQSAAGFGFGMFAIPLLILMGVEAPAAIATIAVCGLLQTVIGSFTLRRYVDWVQVAGMTFLAAACIPLGVWALRHVTLLDPSQVRQFFGAIVLTALLVQWLWRIRPRDTLHWAWGVLAAVLCGFLGGLAGMGGPPVVMWIMAHRWSNPRSRATLWTLFTGMAPLQLYFLHDRFGELVASALPAACLLAPICLLGIFPGLWLGARIAKPRLRQISYLIILFISLYAILQPIVIGAAAAE
jgi:uncharacterized membrane protein YfcA